MSRKEQRLYGILIHVLIGIVVMTAIGAIVISFYAKEKTDKTEGKTTKNQERTSERIGGMPSQDFPIPDDSP